jgi:hypothetical protein
LSGPLGNLNSRWYTSINPDLAMVIVESCGYRFEFSLMRTEVVFNAVRLDRAVASDDVKLVKECLQDMGKWEAVVKGFSDLVREAGLSKAAASIKVFSPDAYKIETKLGENETVGGTVSLSKEERWRRTAGDAGKESALSVEEVTRQVANVDKWRNVRRAISSLV